MLVLLEVTARGHKPYMIEKNLDEFLSVPHIRKVLLLDTITKYGIEIDEIEEVVEDVYDVKGVSSANWKYFNNLDLTKLLPLNNIIINELRPQELNAYDQMFEHSNLPIDCLEQVLTGNYFPMDIAIIKYIYGASTSELIYLLKDILHSKLTVDEIKEDPQLVVDLLLQQDGDLKETFLQTIRQSTDGIVIL